ncbi:reactive intermediate/imine deaminase [Bacteroidia bacterium]|nr:reactive intermediate/imine deaminase [Bacteroidia bacterium]
MKTTINPENAPKTIGPYSQAVEINGMLFLSGQLPIHPETNKIEASDIKGQALQAMENIKEIVTNAGYKMEDIVKCTCFLADMSDFVAFNTVYADYFQGNYPARAVVNVKALPLGALLEVDAIVIR